MPDDVQALLVLDAADGELNLVLRHLDSALSVIDAAPMTTATNAMHAALTVLRAQLAAGDHRKE